jgi:small nuclear ribonucleoprotein (snRNP)-like protein
MKIAKKLLLSLLIAPILLAGCSSDGAYGSQEPEGPTQVNSKLYTLGSVSNPSISGTAKFIENSDATLIIELDLQNTSAGNTHPAHLHMNSAAESGDIVLDLVAVDGASGKSTTTFTALNDGTRITYQGLLGFDGYINVHLGTGNQLSTLIAQGDIGQNELTGQKKSYALSEKDGSGIGGSVEFAERVNASTLVTVSLDGTVDGESYPAHIHENDVATSGAIIAGLNPIDGITGVSKTQISQLVGGAAVTYSQFLTIDAYVNIHLTDNTVIAQGNIGENEGNNSGAAESKTFNVTNSGSTAYLFNGDGLSNASNPNFTFKRGGTYTFNLSVPAHPFLIKSVRGTGQSNAYNSGVTNNGAISGVLTFTVPMNAPSTLFYNCEFHGSMTGTITITN